ncbi:MAG: OmpA family protein [Elusimicrobia bacterium]|nr:OmpA family protein [Elusimicrobiota bacterium]
MPRFAVLPAILAAHLAACAAAPKPFILDDQNSAARESDRDAERRAREAIADIEKRVADGDLPKIQFEFDSDAITPESDPTLDLIAGVVLSNPELKIFILAHCDSVGTEDYNLDLSRRRAKSVASYLVQKGIDPPSIRYHGYGSSHPIADNATAEGRAQNRRVEFRITTRDWNAVY